VVYPSAANLRRSINAITPTELPAIKKIKEVMNNPDGYQIPSGKI